MVVYLSFRCIQGFMVSVLFAPRYWSWSRVHDMLQTCYLSPMMWEYMSQTSRTTLIFFGSSCDSLLEKTSASISDPPFHLYLMKEEAAVRRQTMKSARCFGWHSYFLQDRIIRFLLFEGWKASVTFCSATLRRSSFVESADHFLTWPSSCAWRLGPQLFRKHLLLVPRNLPFCLEYRMPQHFRTLS